MEKLTDKQKQLLKNCRYYKGEKECPRNFTDGQARWWSIECYGVEAGDKTAKGLSPTMIAFIRERVWQSDSGCDTTWDVALERAKELYDLGKWNAGYIASKSANISIAY